MNSMTSCRYAMRWKKTFLILTTILFLYHIIHSHPPPGIISSKFGLHPSSSSTSIMNGSGEGLLQPLYFPPNMREPNHLEPIAAQALIRGNDFVNINDVHLQGILHSGSWLYVVDSEHQILLVRRSNQMVTCPGSWGMIGEHSAWRETPLETARRCIEEELGGHILSSPDIVDTIQPLLGMPLYYKKDYESEETAMSPGQQTLPQQQRQQQARRDRQVTYLWYVKLSLPWNSVKKWDMAEEIAESRWLSLQELEAWLERDRVAVESGRSTEFCDWHLQQLLRVGLRSLKNTLSSSS